LVRATTLGSGVVRVTGVGGDPVVGADGADRRALGRFVAAVALVHRGRVFGRRRALAFLVVVELPRDRAFGGRAEQARDRGLVLEDAAARPARGGLGRRDRRPRRGHVDGLRF